MSDFLLHFSFHSNPIPACAISSLPLFTTIFTTYIPYPSCCFRYFFPAPWVSHPRHVLSSYPPPLPGFRADRETPSRASGMREGAASVAVGLEELLGGSVIACKGNPRQGAIYTLTIVTLETEHIIRFLHDLHDLRPPPSFRSNEFRRVIDVFSVYLILCTNNNNYLSISSRECTVRTARALTA